MNGKRRRKHVDNHLKKEEEEKEEEKICLDIKKGAVAFVAQQPDLITTGIVCYLFLNLLFNIFSFFLFFYDYAQMQSAD